MMDNKRQVSSKQSAETYNQASRGCSTHPAYCLLPTIFNIPASIPISSRDPAPSLAQRGAQGEFTRKSGQDVKNRDPRNCVFLIGKFQKQRWRGRSQTLIQQALSLCSGTRIGGNTLVYIICKIVENQPLFLSVEDIS
jgi:hypothetical protein